MSKNECWNLDQAVAWVMTRDENVVLNLKDGGLAAFIMYPMNPPFCFQREDKNTRNSKDFLDALKKGLIIATGYENGLGNNPIEIKPEWWEDLDIKSTTKPSIAANKYVDGVFWSYVRLKSSAVKKYFPKTPLPASEKACKIELDNIVAELVAESRKNKTKLNRETLYLKVNARLSKGRVSSAWARETLKTLPPDVKNPKHRAPKNNSGK